MEIKGTAVKSIKEFVLNNFKDRYSEWYDALSDASREVFNTVLTSGWYPVELGILEPTRKIGELFYDGDALKAAWESGKYSADVALRGVYKLYVRFSSPAHVVDRGTRIVQAYYNPLKLDQIKREKGYSRFEIGRNQGMDQIIERRIGGWMYQALVVSGCKTSDIKISESVKTHGRTIYDCSWT